MLKNEFAKYVENVLYKRQSDLGLKYYNPIGKGWYTDTYCDFLKESIYKEVKYLDDFYYEFGLSYTERSLTQETIQHVEEKSRINIKALTKFDKLVQYSMYYFTHSSGEKIDPYDLEDKIKALSKEEQEDIFYNIVKSSIEYGEKYICLYIQDFYGDLIRKVKNNHSELVSNEEIINTIETIYKNIATNADNNMKQKLIGLMEKANITNYELNQLEYTQITPAYNSHWYGGDYGGLSRSYTGELDTRIKDYGWVIVVKDLGWNIATDGKNFYLSTLTGPSTKEFSISDIEYTDFEDINKPSIILTEEKLIEYLTSKTKYNPTVGYIKVSISKFDPYFKEGEYSGFGRIYSPDYGERFTHAIKKIQTNYQDLPDCESITLIPEEEKIFYIRFKFLTKKERKDVITECEKYAYHLITTNDKILKNYTHGYIPDDIKCNHFKIGEVEFTN